MPQEEIPIPEGIEVVASEPALKKGKVAFGTKKAWNAVPPYWLSITIRTYMFSASAINILIAAFINDPVTLKSALGVSGAVGTILMGIGKATGVIDPNDKTS